MSALEEADILRLHKDARLLPKAEDMLQCSECLFPASSGPSCQARLIFLTTAKAHVDAGRPALVRTQNPVFVEGDADLRFLVPGLQVLVKKD